MKYLREILIFILIVIVLSSIHTCDRRGDDIDLLKKDTSSIIRHYRNRNGELTSQIEVNEVTIKQLKDYSGQLGVDKDELKKQIGNLSRLVNIHHGKIRITDTIRVLNRDTIYIHKGFEVHEKFFRYKNKFIDLTGVTTGDTTSLDYIYTTDFSMVAYRQRGGLFKPGKLVSDITFSDPNVDVLQYRGLQIIEPKKKFYQTKAFMFGVGLVAGIAITHQ